MKRFYFSTVVLGAFSSGSWRAGASDNSLNHSLKKITEAAAPDIIARSSGGDVIIYFKDGIEYVMRNCGQKVPDKREDCDSKTDVKIPAETFETAYLNQLLFENNLSVLSDEDALNIKRAYGRDLSREKAQIQRDIETLRKLIKNFGDEGDKATKKKLETELKELEIFAKSRAKLDEIRKERDEYVQRHKKFLVNLLQDRKIHTLAAGKGEVVAQRAASSLNEIYSRPPVPCGQGQFDNLEKQMQDCQEKLREKSKQVMSGNTWDLVGVSNQGIQFWRHKETGLVWMDPSTDRFMFEDAKCPDGWNLPTSTQAQRAAKGGMRDVFPMLTGGDHIWIRPDTTQKTPEKWKAGSRDFFVGAGSSARTLKDPKIEELDTKSANFDRVMCVKEATNLAEPVALPGA